MISVPRGTCIASNLYTIRHVRWHPLKDPKSVRAKLYKWSRLTQSSSHTKLRVLCEQFSRQTRVDRRPQLSDIDVVGALSSQFQEVPKHSMSMALRPTGLQSKLQHFTVRMIEMVTSTIRLICRSTPFARGNGIIDTILLWENKIAIRVCHWLLVADRIDESIEIIWIFHLASLYIVASLGRPHAEWINDFVFAFSCLRGGRRSAFNEIQSTTDWIVLIIVLQNFYRWI